MNQTPSHPSDVQFTTEDDRTWTKVREQLFPMQDEVAFDGYLRCRDEMLAGGVSGTPQPSMLSRRLYDRTDFIIVPASGIVGAAEFFEHLRHGRFTAMTKMRPPEEWSFCASPDWIHESVGHATSLGDHRIARMYRKFGEIAAKSNSKHVRRQLALLYWYAFEVGLVREAGKIKAFGAAILSSLSEMANIERAQLRAFNVKDIGLATFDYKATQPTYFVADSVEQLLDEVTIQLDSMGAAQ